MKKILLPIAIILCFLTNLIQTTATSSEYPNVSLSLGDLDMDGVVSVSDARLALRAAVSLDQPSDVIYVCGDVNYSGEIKVDDARLILRAAINLQEFEKLENVDILEGETVVIRSQVRAYIAATQNGYSGTVAQWLNSLQGPKGSNGANGKSAYELAVENGYKGTVQQWLASLAGENGKDGLNGADGKDGTNGKSAYELAVENGYKGTLQEWLASLVGAIGTNGADGKDGANGIDGKDGANGKSAYELAVENGYKGTLAEWLTSLVGKDGINGTDGKDGTNGIDGKNGADGKSAYELAVENGYKGTLQEWLASLVGATGTNGTDGKDGANGIDGKDGANGKSAYELAVENGYKGTLQEWLASLVGAAGTNGTNGKDGADGKDGTDGKDGANGKSAYELAVENGYRGTEEQWLASLVGSSGEKGDKGDKGDTGEKGEQGVGISNVYINAEYHLIVVLTDGRELDAGLIPTVTVTPTEVKKYSVIFKDYDGTVLKTESVEEGKNATPPATPTRTGYTFKSWDCEYQNITSDTIITATYTKNTDSTYTVTFKDYDGTVISTVSEIEKNGYAVPPVSPTRSGYIFSGWNGDYVNVSSDRTVIAEYISSSTDNVLKVSNASGSTGETVTVTLQLAGKVKVCGYDLILKYDSSKLAFVNMTEGSGVSCNNTTDGLLISYLNASCVNDTSGKTIVTVTFNIITDEIGNTPVNVIVDSMFDASDNDVAYSTIVGNVFVK